MTTIKRVPEEILDEEREQVLQRVCAIDVAKDSGQVCVRTPTPGGRRKSTIWVVDATTTAVLGLGEQLAGQRIEMVTLESTSDYWRIFYYLLEACGLPVQLVNARDVKNVPGRPKSDKIDAVWLAKLTERGMLRASFVPPRPVRVLRDYTRTRIDLTRDRTRYYQRLEKLLEDALIKVSAVASTLTTVSTRDMIDALIRGHRDPEVLADLARGAMRRKRPALVQALTGAFDDHHAELAAILLGQIDALTPQIEHLTARIDQLIAQLPPTTGPGPDAGPPSTDTATPPDATAEHATAEHATAEHATEHATAEHATAEHATAEHATAERGAGQAPAIGPGVIQRLADIPGVSVEAAQVIVAEIGLDMTRFPTAQHLVSWAHLSPRLIQSGPKRRGGKTSRGNPYLKGILGIAAAAAARTHTFLGERYARIVKRRGKGKALVAVSRSILVIVWHLLTDPDATYYDLGAHYYPSHINMQRKIRNHVRQLEALGLRVTLTPATA
jgi:transposase